MFARVCIGMLGATLVAGSMGYAQEQPQGGPPNFAQMRQQMMDRLRDAMGATDDEWKLLEPRIEKVEQLQRQTGGRGPGMFGPPPGGPRASGGPANSLGPDNAGGPGAGDPSRGGPDNSGGPDAGGPPRGGPTNSGGPDGGGPPPGASNGGLAGPGGPERQPLAEVQQRQSDLREALQDKDASPDQVKAKVAALRDARSRTKTQLAQAQEELRSLLSLRQEAVLVAVGILE